MLVKIIALQYKKSLFKDNLQFVKGWVNHYCIRRLYMTQLLIKPNQNFYLNHGL